MSITYPPPDLRRPSELPFVLALKRALDRALVRAAAPNATDEERAAARRLQTLLKARGRWEATQQ